MEMDYPSFPELCIQFQIYLILLLLSANDQYTDAYPIYSVVDRSLLLLALLQGYHTHPGTSTFLVICFPCYMI